MNKIIPSKSPPGENVGNELATATALFPPKLLVLLGRGSRGKTWFARWAAERAQNQGRAIVVADADRTNATLSAYFGGVLTPPSADDADMRDWFIAFCEQQIQELFTAMLDLGGGDLMLKRIAREVGLVSFLESQKIQPVAVHLLGPDRDDLAYLRDVEADDLFAPRATILVLNEALVPSNRSVRTAFQPVIEHPIFLAALARGARPVWMPRLVPAHEVDARRITFAAAETGGVTEGQPPIGPFNRQLIANWRRVMETNFASVAEWLP